MEENERGWLTLCIADNGCGMTRGNPAPGARPLLYHPQNAEGGHGNIAAAIGGRANWRSLTIESVHESINPADHGTTLTATFDTRSIDFPPLGDIVETLCVTIQGYPEIDYRFTHVTPAHIVQLDTTELREVLGDVSLGEFAVIEWIREYLREQYQNPAKNETNT